MSGAVEITRRDMTPAELRAASGRAKDGRAARRMLAIALALEGVDRKTAAESCGMDRQTLRDWVHRYNAEGLSGLENRAGAGRKPRLDLAGQQSLAHPQGSCVVFPAAARSQVGLGVHAHRRR